MKKKHYLLMFPIIIILLCSMEAAVGEALIRGCQQLVNEVDRQTGFSEKAWDKLTGSNNTYSGPAIVDDNSRTISNYSSYPVTVIYADGQSVLFPNDSQIFNNENPDRKWDDFQTSFSYRYNENLVTMERSGDYWGVTFFDKIIDDEEPDVSEETESNIPIGTSARVEDDLKNRPSKTRVRAPPPPPPLSAKPEPTINNNPGGKTPYPAANPFAGSGDPPISYSTYTAPPVSDIRVIPILPNPHSGKIYRLLVGNYLDADSAFRAYRQLQAASFEAVQEQAGNIYKVYAVGIPASSVYYATRRLGAIGFEKVWVFE